ncbi:UDP-N-acetylglucosamine--N-acetylmuramyl-(pentapeptide) pyrophosphoryl-undecaprenol N-acetylglucosamine transferase [hydrothermal vent metagenome]|uniref:UDP-N-acetylglucosamine--N-acetylmuramyl-(Pentapeptide) pyrophosphoryl-undecaprenol N-acetylglucosamine transferase n=1 Tax=hydrothermal vent metagenome TaxID=652676 RepID=A0A3B0XXS9_9ZZZZ
MSKRPVLVMAGGTGGHIFPALAVAKEMMARGIPVVWLGTKKGLEAKIIPAEGIPVKWLSVSGIRGKGKLRLLSAPFMLSWAITQALWVMISLRPRAVLGMGGFVTGPGGLAAKLTFRPICIHEQNAIPGMTNRLLSKIAKHVCEAFPQSFGKLKKTTLTGNPVRAEIVAIVKPEERLANRSKPVRLLVLGGSLGAQAINDTLPKALALLSSELMPEVRHQAGARNLEAAVNSYQQAGVKINPVAFIEDMAEAYAWADLILCRAGALTLAEITATGVASILVPYPHAVDDHQTANAKYLTDENAAILLPQPKLQADDLAETLKTLFADRDKLLTMAKAARHLAIPNSAEQVADIVLGMARGK